MASIPEGAAQKVVAAVGAYMRATPPQELPPKLRPLRNFRSRALLQRRADILASLEEPALRARILEWLDDGHTPLSRDEIEALRIASAREEGWEEALAIRAPSPAPRGEARGKVSDAEVLQREKEKTARAKEEARRARQELAEVRRSAKAEERGAAAEIARLRKAVAEAQRAAAAARADVERYLAREERESRKARAAVDKAQRERDLARTQARDARREVTKLKRDIVRLQDRISMLASASARRTKDGDRTRRRSALKAPRGLLEDAPEALDAWLSRDGVHLLVDGYNVTRMEGGFGELKLEQQRDRLVEEVDRLVRRKGTTATIVFDGAHVPAGVSRRRRGPVRVEYSRPDEIADDHIVARLEDLPSDPVILVTSDRELQDRGREKGATIATSRQLLKLLR